MKIGLIGFGFMGGVHLSAIQSIAGASVAAVATRARPSADAPARGNLPHAQSSGLPPDVAWHPDWRALVEDEAIDAVDICLPTDLHREVALAAFARGKHVLCEKPMALASADCDAMLEAAAKSGRVFMVAHVLRFLSPYRYAASFVGKNNVKSAVFRRKSGFPQWSDWLANKRRSGGAALDLLCHDIDIALKLFGPATAVSAVSDGEIDTLSGVLRRGDGLEVRIEGGWYKPGMPFAAGFEIASEEAVLTLNAGKLELTREGRAEAVELPENLEYVEQMAYFVECCRGNAAPEQCLPAESAEAVRVANLLRESRALGGKEISCER
jgi:predicted dehydrogenase